MYLVTCHHCTYVRFCMQCGSTSLNTFPTQQQAKQTVCCSSHLLLSDPSVLQEDKPHFSESCFQIFAQTDHLLLTNILLSQAARAEVHHRNAHLKNNVYLKGFSICSQVRIKQHSG